MDKTEKRQGVVQTLRSTRFMFARVWKLRAGKGYVALKFIMALLDAALSFAAAVMPGLIIDQLMGREVSSWLILEVTILVLGPLLGEVLTGIGGRVICSLGQKIQLTYIEEFYRHTIKMDYEMLEKPDIQEQKGRAIDLLGNCLGVVDQIGALFRSMVSLFLLISIISLLNPLVILVMLFAIVGNSIVLNHLNQKSYNFDKEIGRRKRKQDAMQHMLDMFEYAKDTRLFRAGGLLVEKFAASRREMNVPIREKQAAANLAFLETAFLGLISRAVLYAYLVYMVAQKGMTVGNAVVFLSASEKFSAALDSILNAWLALAADAMKVEDYLKFINIPREQYGSGTKQPVFNRESVIEFKNVSFRYPGKDCFALKDFNLVIKGREKLCIVGENGAGKSTFIKLLTRLYSPTEGEILLNGINVNEYDYEKYQCLFAAVFQDFAQFYMTVGENIVLADSYDRERLDWACDEAGLTSVVEGLPQGYDTQVSKWIDESGVDLSGGESQKMAIARACYHAGEIYLLDEPTAELDPNAEYKIYQQFDHMTEEKCAIFITHRLAAVQLADKIAVFEEGRIVEYGTHEELYAKQGIYSGMLDRQAEFYRNTENEEECMEGAAE